MARETFLRCDRRRERPIFRGEELDALVGPGRVFRHDIAVHAGLALFRRSRTADDVVDALEDRTVSISETGVRELAERFIVSLGIAHAAAALRLRARLRAGGGFIPISTPPARARARNARMQLRGF